MALHLLAAAAGPVRWHHPLAGPHRSGWWRHHFVGRPGPHCSTQWAWHHRHSQYSTRSLVGADSTPARPVRKVAHRQHRLLGCRWEPKGSRWAEKGLGYCCWWLGPHRHYSCSWEEEDCWGGSSPLGAVLEALLAEIRSHCHCHRHCCWLHRCLVSDLERIRVGCQSGSPVRSLVGW